MKLTSNENQLTKSQLVKHQKQRRILALDLAGSQTFLNLSEDPSHVAAVVPFQHLDLATNYRLRDESSAKVGAVALITTKLAKSGTAFVFFPALPKEIRQKIWNFCIAQHVEQRIITISEIARDNFIDDCGDFPKSHFDNVLDHKKIHRRLTITSEPLPHLLLACKEVSEAGMFKAVRVKGCQKAYLYSPIFDSIRLSSIGHPPGKLLSDEIDIATLARIQHLQLDGDLVNPDAASWAITNINLMTGLKTLEINGNCMVLPGFDAPPNINMTYEAVVRNTLQLISTPLDPSIPPLYIPACRAGGQNLRGPNAHYAIFDRVTDDFERGRYINTLRFLDIAARCCKNLPFVISIFFRYNVYSWTDALGTDGIAINERRVFDYGDVIDGLVTLE